LKQKVGMQEAIDHRGQPAISEQGRTGAIRKLHRRHIFLQARLLNRLCFEAQVG